MTPKIPWCVAPETIALLRNLATDVQLLPSWEVFRVGAVMKMLPGILHTDFLAYRDF